MKLQPEFDQLLCRYKQNFLVGSVQIHELHLKQSGKYSDFETRAAWDLLNAVVSASEICGWYKKYDCDDTHVNTLAKALRKAFLDKSLV